MSAYPITDHIFGSGSVVERPAVYIPTPEQEARLREALGAVAHEDKNFKPHRSSTMLGDPRNARYGARQTAYGAWRVFDFHINSWVGNGWEEQGPANSLARKLNRGSHDEA